MSSIYILLLVFAIPVSATKLHFHLSGDHGQFSSPNYPNKYPVNMTCRWTIGTAPHTRILLNFTDFKLEKNKKCLYDYLIIKESRNGWGTISSKYCGHGILTTYLSQENHLQIYFVSDKLGNVDKGFVANWKTTDLNGNVINYKGFPISPTNSAKSCPTVTVTKAAKPCTKIRLEPTTVLSGTKSTRCKCPSASEKTVYRTVTEYHGQGQNVKPTASTSGVQMQATITRNGIPRNGSDCGNNATYGKPTHTDTTNRNIVIAFGCLLFVLIVANIVLVAVICRRDNTGYSLYSMKTCLPRKASKPRNVEHFYSSGPRPTLRMVDGDIVVVSPNGRVVRQQAPGDQTTLETSDNSHVQVQVTPQNENRARTSERIAPEIPFHLVPPPEGQSTLSSGEMSCLNECSRESSASDAESDFY